MPQRRKGQRSTASDTVAGVRQFVLIASDDLIAGILNRNGLATGNGNRWTRERVTSLRSNYKIPLYRPAPDGVEPYLNLSKAATLLGITAKTLRLAAEADEIAAVHPLANGPWIFGREVLAGSQAQALVMRVKATVRSATGSHPDQETLFPSMA